MDSVVLACTPDTVEDQIWDRHTIFESGFTPVPEDDRTPGEFLVGELSFSDTVMLSDPALVPVDPALRTRGVQLLKELAPHAVIADAEGAVELGRHRLAKAVARTAPGYRIAIQGIGPESAPGLAATSTSKGEGAGEVIHPLPRPAPEQGTLLKRTLGEAP